MARFGVLAGFGSPTSTPEVRELLELTAESRRKGLPIRVAVIREVTDLGAVPTLFGHAQRYATFLEQELRFVYHGTLVVVMGGSPGGIGVVGPGATPAAKAAVRGLPFRLPAMHARSPRSDRRRFVACPPPTAMS